MARLERSTHYKAVNFDVKRNNRVYSFDWELLIMVRNNLETLLIYYSVVDLFEDKKKYVRNQKHSREERNKMDHICIRLYEPANASSLCVVKFLTSICINDLAMAKMIIYKKTKKFYLFVLFILIYYLVIVERKTKIIFQECDIDNHLNQNCNAVENEYSKLIVESCESWKVVGSSVMRRFKISSTG